MLRLNLPDYLRDDPYFLSLIESAEEYFDELRTEIRDMSTMDINAMNRLDLIEFSSMFGIEDAITRLPLVRARFMVNEIVHLLKNKGSEAAIIKMTQIYLGVTSCKVEYKANERLYDMRVLYGEIAEPDAEFSRTLYDLVLRFVNPATRKLGQIIAEVEPQTYGLNKVNLVKTQSGLRNMQGTRLKDLGVYRRNTFVKANRDDLLNERIVKYVGEDIDSETLEIYSENVRVNILHLDDEPSIGIMASKLDEVAIDYKSLASRIRVHNPDFTLN